MTKKADLSINMIIVAVLALLVLVILIFVLSKGGTGLNEGTDCGLKGGICTTQNQECTELINGGTCSNNGDCCAPYAIKGQ
ncbi:hypothetical protein K9L67_03660 [Candidatus Woesearchaeota archaeon]|nr:hypothetical protein [Candidatus Woesearchaeota archaeon]MCF7901298.1 hypothetical protein [Candidatus Woesearchaeota archaeon]MCF8013796.1 hypothetical protein [Candidatus Woesearchaeota archaeon]